jgi:hypothetical protein
LYQLSILNKFASPSIYSFEIGPALQRERGKRRRRDKRVGARRKRGEKRRKEKIEDEIEDR